MQNEIQTIRLAMPFGMGSVNCYLIKTGDGFVLIDTGASGARRLLLDALESAGCRPGLLRLILITHGDFDHTGSAAHLRQAFGASIAMHRDDTGMGEQGDMFVNRKRPNFLIRSLIQLFTGFGKAERFSPDILLEDGQDLSEYGLEARIVSIPGHSKGSIGILNADGELFCGDLFENTKKPALNSLMDDPEAGKASIRRLRELGVKKLFPGHGQPFLTEQIEK